VTRVLLSVESCAWLAAALLFVAQPPAEKKPVPFFNAREHQADYYGPGREDVPPESLQHVEIGYYGPSDPNDPLYGDMWQAAQLAIADANARGGYGGVPFRLVPAWSTNPWAASVRQVTDLVFTRKVWAVVGGADSATSHLAEQIVAKANVPLVCPVSTDKTVNLANVPWTFAVVPGDHRLASLLAEAIVRLPRKNAIVRVLTDDHDSRMFSRELDRALQERHLAARFGFVVPARIETEPAAVAQALECSPDALLVIANAVDSAELVRCARARGYTGPIFGSPAMGRRVFLLKSGRSAEDAAFPLLFDIDNPPDRGFVSRFRSLSGHDPDYSAAHTYDAVQLTLAAVQASGLNRARLRDAIAKNSPWNGVSGVIRWDGLGSNVREARLGKVLEGRLQLAPGQPVPSESTSRCDPR
jgi:branched-chain amino acid transport system substrate-binding protein